MDSTIFFTAVLMLNCSKYRTLEQNEQVDLLMGDGVYLDLTRYTSNSYIELYALEDFYVEVFFDKLTEEPLFLRPFAELRYLDPYLEDISIKQLFQYR